MRCEDMGAREKQMLVTGCWLLDAGYWILVSGCLMLDAGYWKLVTGYRILDPGHSLLEWTNGRC